MTDDLVQTLKDVTRFRILLMIVVIVGLGYLRPAEMQPLGLGILAILFALYLLALHFVLFPRFLSRGLMLAMVLADILFISAALYLTGGVESILFTLYPISIMYSAVSLGYLGAFVAATAVTLSYGVLLALTGTPANIAGFLPIQMPFFFLLAGLSGYVVEMETRQRQQAQSLREMLQLERGAKELLQVSRELNTTLDRAEVLPRVAEVAAQVTGLSRCLFVLLDEQGRVTGESSNLAAAGESLAGIREMIERPHENGATRAAMESRGPVVVEDAQRDLRVPGEAAQRLGLTSFIMLPLMHDDDVLGIMYVDDGGKAHRFTVREINLSRSFADQAAIAIFNAQRYGEAQARIQDLVAEMRAVAQHSQGVVRTAGAARPAEMVFDGLEINAQLRRVSVQGKPVSLSWTEFELLHFLATTPDVAYSRETIFRKVWKQEYYISTNLVDVCVHRLRQKIEANPAEPRYVQTVHGVGYLFAREGPPGAGPGEEQAGT